MGETVNGSAVADNRSQAAPTDRTADAAGYDTNEPLMSLGIESGRNTRRRLRHGPGCPWRLIAALAPTFT